MNKTLFLLYFLPLLAGISCSEAPYFREDQNTPNGWEIDQPIVFNFQDPLDVPADVFIHLRNDEEYPFSNIFLIASVRSKDSLITSDTLEFAMAKPNGEWLGRGFTAVKESKLWWKENWQAQLPPPYTLEIAQANRFNGREKAAAQLAGIVSVGVSINPRE